MRIQTARRHDTATATSSTSAATATGCAPIRTYGEPPGHRRSRKPLPREPRDCHASGLKRRRPGAGLWSLRSRRPPQDPIKATERAQAGPRLPSPESAQFSVARNAQFSSAIDSWAGKPPPRLASRRRLQVHPRVGGETAVPDADLHVHGGPSPRGRGNQLCIRDQKARLGSIPAWAGKPVSESARNHLREVHPRVGGETVRSAASPPLRWHWIGSIPAWAGETESLRPGHPASWRGPSPRGRGNRCVSRSSVSALELCRSIPAWAGKPAMRVRRSRHSLYRSIPAWAGKPSLAVRRRC